MLQSPKKTSEPRVRLAVVDEAASQKDSKSSQLKQVACNSAVKKGYKKQHKRHLSAPEDMLMMSALRNLQPAPPRLPDGSIPQEGFNPTQLDMNMGMDANGMVKHEHRPLTPPNRRASMFSPMTPRSPYMQNMGGPVQGLKQGHIRRASLMNIPSGMRMVYPESMEDMYARSDALPTPPHTAPLRGLNQFNMGAMHDTQFMSMNSIALSAGMPEEDLDQSYFSPMSEVAPPFSSMHTTPEAQHAGLYGQMPTSTSDMPSQMPASVNSIGQSDSSNGQGSRPLPPLAPAMNGLPNTMPADLKNALSVSANIVKKPRQMLFSTEEPTISPDEIASFISGPEPQDGKWVCLYGGCGKRFGRKENIKSHVQTHLGDRQYKCFVCYKCFVRQHDLKRHSKIHTGVKPYQCQCGNSFARHDALTRHRQRGMCVGAFEGIVKKVVKRGRPRKRPLPESTDGTDTSTAKAPSASKSGSKSSEPPSVLQSASSSMSGSTRENSRTASPESSGSPPPLSPAPHSPQHFDFNSFLSDSPHPPQLVDSTTGSSSSPLQLPTTSAEYNTAFRKYSLSLENPIVTSAGHNSGIPASSHFSEMDFLNGDMGGLANDLLDFSGMGAGNLGLCSAPEDSYIRPEVLGGGFVR